MEENKTIDVQKEVMEEEKSFFNFQVIFTNLILYWKWFLVCLIISLGTAYIYLRYTTPVYQVAAKLLIKDDDAKMSRRYANSIQSATNLGFVSNSYGIDNEVEILNSHSLAMDVVRDLKLYVEYRMEGRMKDPLLYKTQPINVDIDATHLEDLAAPITLEISRKGNSYRIKGKYFYQNKDNELVGPIAIDQAFSTLPTTINTKAGVLTLTKNNGFNFPDNRDLLVTIKAPKYAAYKYINGFSVKPTSKMTTIAALSLSDQIPYRGIDYLRQLAVCYNRQANEDKNEVAVRTEKFINERLAKINEELGSTEGELESYKKRNNMVELKINATQNVQYTAQLEQQLAEANTQMVLLNSISEYLNKPSNKYQVLPFNVGLTDPSSTNLINSYNQIALQRNHLLKSASESSPMVTPLTAQLDELSSSLRQALTQAKHNQQIKRDAIASQYNKYNSSVLQTPSQERILTQIGRQQEVKSGLYLMLLQKREENSISLAATADKGKLIDEPQYAGKVSPKTGIIYLIALLLGLGIPALCLFMINFFRYKIEGHDDVAALTTLPILVDVAVASDTAKTKADIVVHENKNNQMEEIFRSMRTNLQFMLEEGENVIMFTSSTSGEGKTFNCANLAVSFALLNKKVILLGLDIRKPRLAELFEINDHHHGITPLLTHEASHITMEQIKEQILPSGVHKNLDLLMSGPIPPNPAELIARPALDRIIEMLKTEYDYILIDTAPVGLVTDTLAIARVCNATIYMCRADYTPKSSFDLINGLNAEGKLPKMSIVINGIDMSKKKYGYYYGYGKYGKYGRYGRYGSYGKYGRYGRYGYGYGGYGYGRYGTYGSYGNYSNSHYGDKNDTSVKR